MGITVLLISQNNVTKTKHRRNKKTKLVKTKILRFITQEESIQYSFMWLPLFCLLKRL